MAKTETKVENTDAEEAKKLLAEAEKAKAEAEKAKAEAEAMKAEAEKLKAELEAKKEAMAAAHSDDTVTKTVDSGDELVNVKLFKDGGAYKDDLTVGVNGKFIKIQRGKSVEIAKKYAEVIEHSNIQDAATAELIEQKSSEYETATKKYE